MDNCLFCRIISGQIPSDMVYQDDHCLAFRDIAPQAPQHALLVPRQHVSGLNQLDSLPDEQLLALMRALPKVAGALGIQESGYRVVSNCGSHACQSVGHLHLHILGGTQLSGQMA